ASSLRFGFTHFFKAVEDLGFDPATRGITFKEPSLEPTVGEHSLPFLAKNHWTLSYDWRGTNPAQRSGIRLTSLGSRTRPAQYHSAKDLGDKYPALVSKNNLGGEFLVDIHTTLPLFEDVELRIGISNLLDQKVFSGPYGNEDQYDIEWAGRTYSLMVSSKF
ncbi:TonB-dependent receptor, partial [bacterium]|nr:TonB-dependent receptor [bacterium]